MKKYRDILLDMNMEEANTKKKFSIDQINLILLKAGIGPKIIMQAMNALNLARGLGLTECLKAGKKG